MTIHLPNDVERSLEAMVRSGRLASVDEAMTKAAHLLLQELGQEAEPGAAGGLDEGVNDAIPRRLKPIWEVAAEIRGGVPAKEWAKLPADGAEQHDHYGSPKRPTS